MRSTAWLLPCCAGGIALLLGGCELTEVMSAAAEDVVVAEVVLRGGQSRQMAYLHRTRSGHADGRVFNASVVVRAADGEEPIVFTATEDSVCLRPSPTSTWPELGTCYATSPRAPAIRPGVRYSLEIVLNDGRRLTGSTTVPAEFEITRPSSLACRLEPRTTLELAWTRSAGASVYIGEAILLGLHQALRAAGTPVDGSGPVRLLGLSIGAADTTMAFPGDFGVFDRFDADVHPLLVAIRDGLPPGVATDIAIAAADLNYVNWVRGGTFNPSGTVRVPSVYGDGTGVFGSVIVRGAELSTSAPDRPDCRE